MSTICFCKVFMQTKDSHYTPTLYESFHWSREQQGPQLAKGNSEQRSFAHTEFYMLSNKCKLASDCTFFTIFYIYFTKVVHIICNCKHESSPFTQ